MLKRCSSCTTCKSFAQIFDNTKGTATIITDHINLKSKVPQEQYNFLYESETQHYPALQCNNADISCVVNLSVDANTIELNTDK